MTLAYSAGVCLLVECGQEFHGRQPCHKGLKTSPEKEVTAMLENIDTQVGQQLEIQGVPTPTPATPPSGGPPAPAPEPTALEVANARIAALEAEQSAKEVQHESALAESRLKIAAAEAHKPSEKLNTARQDTQVAQAIRAAKGLAFWNRLPEQQKAAALGVPDTSSIKTSLVQQFFGSTSSSLKAGQLGNNDPSQYMLLRLVAKFRGFIG